ncbi:hypothetical protein GCK72_026042 [Caenorhabditis remanei]|uniref:Uncharacterized protein n=1 Tax=Caenorhabditis remanei TaxID=31234 RepID=A0A6A5G4R8_CAERE|nr:hypothetical protein GCK72_026042 [Caenorhabditis remanei]KAF1749574.1 hypothetical protein GCK72_026042 [Caenorhabditis remanei]
MLIVNDRPEFSKVEVLIIAVIGRGWDRTSTTSSFRQRFRNDILSHHRSQWAILPMEHPSETFDRQRDIWPKFMRDFLEKYLDRADMLATPF